MEGRRSHKAMSFSGVTFVSFCFVTTVCVLFFFFGDVAFSEYFWYLYRFLFEESTFSSFLYIIIIVRFRLPNNGDFLPCDHGLDF